MFALLRLSVIGFIVLTVIYVCLSFYSRAVRRGKLEAEWEEEGMTGDRDAFVRAGLEDYDGSLRRKLILGVYVVPVCVVIALIYFTNFH
jgi:predicted permease